MISSLHLGNNSVGFHLEYFFTPNCKTRFHLEALSNRFGPNCCDTKIWSKCLCEDHLVLYLKSDINLFTCFWFFSKINISQIFHQSILTSVFMCNMCCIWSFCFRCIHPFTVNFDDIICEDASVTPVIWFMLLFPFYYF